MQLWAQRALMAELEGPHVHNDALCQGIDLLQILCDLG
jgi:hypothetical protein